MSETKSTTQPTGAGIFSAADLKHRMAEREAAKAAEELRHMKEQEEKQKAVTEELHKPLERTAEQLMDRTADDQDASFFTLLKRKGLPHLFRLKTASANRRLRRHWPPDAMPSRCCERPAQTTLRLLD